MKHKGVYQDNLINYIHSVLDVEKVTDLTRGMTNKQRNIIYQLLYVKYVSALDFYIGQEISDMILSSKDYIEKYLCKKRKKTPSVAETIWDRACRRLEYENFQNVNNVREIFERTFHIEIAEHQEIKDAVGIRNKIIHNGGWDNENPIKITRKNLYELKRYQRIYVRDIIDALASAKAKRLISK